MSEFEEVFDHPDNKGQYLTKQELEEYMVENISTVDFRGEDTEPVSFKPTTSTTNNVFEL